MAALRSRDESCAAMKNKMRRREKVRKVMRRCKGLRFSTIGGCDADEVKLGFKVLMVV